MNDADRAAWLAKVEGMTRSERIEALIDSACVIRHGKSVNERVGERRFALDLIAALERAAVIAAMVSPAEREMARLRAEAQP